MRARSAQDWLTYLEQRDPDAHAHVLSQIPEGSRELILTAPKTEWVDVVHDRHVPHATIEVLGEARSNELWRQFIGAHLEAPLFRGLVDAMVRLFGLQPGTFVRLLPRAWKQTFRDCCEVEVLETREHLARLAFTDVHEDIITWPAYPQSWCSILSGVFDITHHEGTCTMQLDPPAHRIEFEWRW